jgi:hypothetical protein
MPSIFVWKTTAALNSETTIRCLIGAHWHMEEHSHSSTCVRYRNQCKLSLEPSVLVWDAERMPESWVGSTCLDIISVPYQLIKKDSYAILEQVGKWLRCTVIKEIEFTNDRLSREYHTIQNWIHMKTTPVDEPCQISFTIPPVSVVSATDTYDSSHHVTHSTEHFNKTNHTVYRSHHSSFKPIRT